MTALAPELPALARSVIALAVVIALVAAARRYLPRSAAVGSSDEPLTLAASLSLDARTQLVIVRRGPAEFLLAVGAHGVTRLDGPGTLAERGSDRP
jgi:flagellar biogenesis protein FliO